MGKNFLFKSCLVLALIMAFCTKAASQSTNDIPKEGNMFYMENGKTRTVKASTRGDNDPQWSFKSVIENCYDNKKYKDQEAWMMTADGETKLKVTFEYKTADESYDIDSTWVEFCFYDGKDLFHDEENVIFFDDENISGTFTMEQTKKTVTLHLTAPPVFPNPSYAWYTYYVVLHLKLKGLGEAAVARQIGISRNGLFLLHGLNSSRECFFPFREYLLNTAKSYFVKQIYLGDYSSSNTSSFSDNTHKNEVVKKGLHQLCESMLKAGIASTKYDMVGHSMGGILERLYVQEVDDNHTNRLITLNTPHFGSMLGNIYQKYDEFLEDHPGVELYHGVEKFNQALDAAFSKDRSMQAVKDLGENSPAIQKLAKNSPMLLGIPVCAVGSEVNEWGLRMAVKEVFYAKFPKLASFLFDSKPGTGKAYLDKIAEKGSDYVVSVESQKGGCEKSFIYKGDFSQAMHCSVTEWNIIHEELNNLLTATDTYGLFTTGSFAEALPTPASTRGEADEIEFVEGFEEPKPTSFIKIEAEKVDGKDYTHEIRLTHSDDMMAQVAFCLLSPDDLIADYEKDVMYFDMSGYEGEKWIYAFGRTNYNALVVDSVKVTLGEGGSGIKSVEDNAALRYAVIGNILNIKNITGPYSVAVYNYAGQMLAEMESNPSHMYALPRNKGLLIVGVRSNKGNQFLKVMSK